MLCDYSGNNLVITCQFLIITTLVELVPLLRFSEWITRRRKPESGVSRLRSAEQKGPSIKGHWWELRAAISGRAFCMGDALLITAFSRQQGEGATRPSPLTHNYCDLFSPLWLGSPQTAARLVPTRAAEGRPLTSAPGRSSNSLVGPSGSFQVRTRPTCRTWRFNSLSLLSLVIVCYRLLHHRVLDSTSRWQKCISAC